MQKVSTVGRHRAHRPRHDNDERKDRDNLVEVVGPLAGNPDIHVDLED